MRRLCTSLAITACGLLSAAEFSEQSPRTRLSAGEALYLSQTVIGPDQPVGEAISIGTATIPAQLDDRGRLQLDTRGTGRFRAVRTGAQTIDVGLTADGDTSKMKVYLHQNPAGEWLWRNAMQVTIAVGNEGLIAVDCNGDGTFNQAGIDGLTWPGHTYVFPFPAPNERFCTPSLELTGLTMGPWGEDCRVQMRPLVTTRPEALPILQNTNLERVQIGLTPRPEDPSLSADLQKHCDYMHANQKLTHPQQQGNPGYSPEGHAAGMRSILSMGTPAERIGTMMVTTYFHRQDVIRPDTSAFGVGITGRYGGIDGRTTMGAPVPNSAWPIHCPAPNQTGVPTAFSNESPDPIPAGASRQAGYPITLYFRSGRPSLLSHRLERVLPNGQRQTVPCHSFDHQTGASANMTAYQHAVALIPHARLDDGAIYEVEMVVNAGGEQTFSWRFGTGRAPTRGWQQYAAQR